MEDEELISALRERSEEERGALLDQVSGWKHPGRLAQRWIAGLLFALGAVWALMLVLSLFLIVGIVANVFFIFGWLIYGGWFYTMMGMTMAVSLRFFWIASICVHALYLWLLGRSDALNEGALTITSPQVTWWAVIGFSVIALCCEIWAQRGTKLS